MLYHTQYLRGTKLQKIALGLLNFANIQEDYIDFLGFVKQDQKLVNTYMVHKMINAYGGGTMVNA